MEKKMAGHDDGRRAFLKGVALSGVAATAGVAPALAQTPAPAKLPASPGEVRDAKPVPPLPESTDRPEGLTF